MEDYTETNDIYDIKVSIYVLRSKLNESMEIYMYQKSMSFFDLCPRSLSFHQSQTADHSFCSLATGQTGQIT